jgi:hypothetical protein
MSCHANQQLICGVEKQLEPNNLCVGIPIPLKLYKLHRRIMYAMPCISYLDHADSFAVVVNCASVVCSSASLLHG